MGTRSVRTAGQPLRDDEVHGRTRGVQSAEEPPRQQDGRPGRLRGLLSAAEFGWTVQRPFTRQPAPACFFDRFFLIRAPMLYLFIAVQVVWGQITVWKLSNVYLVMRFIFMTFLDFSAFHFQQFQVYSHTFSGPTW